MAGANVAGTLDSWQKSKELRSRIWFTLFILFIYRLGTYIPIPGVNPLVLKDIMSVKSGFLGMFDLFSGGALGRMTIFALNIVPYITASILIQLFTAVSPTLTELKKEGESGRLKINQYTRYLTLFICLIQSFSISIALESMTSSLGSAVINPGWMFRFMTAFTVTSGTFFILWMGEKITERGIGNGVSLIIFSGIVSNLPIALGALFSMGEKGTISGVMLVGILVMIIAVIVGVVFIETAQRRLVVKYARRQLGANRVTNAETSYLPLKINNAGVIPPIFASSLLLLPISLMTFFATSNDSILGTLTIYLSRGSALYLLLYAIFIAFFAFFYVSMVFNPEETSDNLKNYGGVVLGVRPGDNTTKYISTILNKLTAIGSVYLILVCLLPELLISKLSLPFYFGGTSLLIVVSVTIDTITQVQSHLMAQQYEGVLEKAKIGKKNKKRK